MSGSSAPSVRDALTARAADSRWAVPLVALLLAAAGTLCITIGQDLESRGDWWWVIGGVVLALLGGVLQWARELGKSEALESGALEAERLRIAMKDALQPLAELIADLPDKTPAERKRSLTAIAHQAVSALTLLMKDVDRLRAVVYQLDDDDSGMSYVAYHGRGNTPNPFLKTTQRGELACKMVQDGANHFEPDISKASSEAYKGTGNGYNTFISAAICTGKVGYGMVTVDAPHAHDLTDTDRQIVCLVADLLAIAYSIADAR